MKPSQLPVKKSFIDDHNPPASSFNQNPTGNSPDIASTERISTPDSLKDIGQGESSQRSASGQSSVEPGQLVTVRISTL